MRINAKTVNMFWCCSMQLKFSYIHASTLRSVKRTLKYRYILTKVSKFRSVPKRSRCALRHVSFGCLWTTCIRIWWTWLPYCNLIKVEPLLLSSSENEFYFGRNHWTAGNLGFKCWLAETWWLQGKRKVFLDLRELSARSHWQDLHYFAYV